MKVVLLRWTWCDGYDGYDGQEGIIGLYKTRESAEKAAIAWANTMTNNSEDYKYSFEEMEIND